MPIGLGLMGKPGLNNGGDVTPAFGGGDLEAFNIPAREPAFSSGGERALICASGGEMGIVGRGLKGIGVVSFGVFDLDFGFPFILPFELFLDKLLASASLAAAISRTLSSSSLVFRLPRSGNDGISSTSRISS
jgi:hypothetical protein